MQCIVLATCVFALHLGSCKVLTSYTHNYKDVKLNTGTVRGFLADDGDYFAYLGIPYATPPLGSLRFKAPLPPTSWNGVFIANRTVVCPQIDFGDEDCLIANIFTPTKLSKKPLPVLVYIHGGSFLLGSGQTKGLKTLIKQDVIVVTVNYRLGALGFLCLRTTEAPGNAGLKDLVAALKWVQRNIDRFGGEFNLVTIYGMSAGAASVEMLVLSEMAKGLFHGAIIESGSALNVWSLDANPIATAENFLSFTDFANDTGSFDQLVNFYQNEPAKKLSNANYIYYQNLTDGTFGFVPCLEKNINGDEPFLINNPDNILKSGAYNKVPLMYIFASLEGLFLRSSDYYELNYRDKMNDRFEDFMPADLIFDTEEIKNTIKENVKQFYFGDKSIGNGTLKEYFNYFGDLLVLHGLLNSAINHATLGDVVYLMEFAYKGKLGSYEKFFENVNYVGHGDAIKYAILNEQIENDDDKLTVERMTKIIANFMIYGNPSPTQNELIPVPWPAVQPDNITYLLIDKDLQVLQKPFWKRQLFWDELYQKYRKPLRPVGQDLSN